jgi:hypothetical protein
VRVSTKSTSRSLDDDAARDERLRSRAIQPLESESGFHCPHVELDALSPIST